jgi:transcriptional regulator of heat shock response
MPEFFDIDVTRTLLGLLDESRRLLDALNQANDQNDINLLFGDEMGFQCLEPCGMVFIKYHTGHNQGSLGVIGANRFHYSEIIPLVRYYANLIEELSASE